MSWKGIDFDGTLAHYEDWEQHGYIPGPPIPVMVERVKKWLDEGEEVRILTARVCSGQPYGIAKAQRLILTEWCIEHLGQAIPITSEKDFHMEILWDDRAVRVRKNEGTPCCAHHEEIGDAQ